MIIWVQFIICAAIIVVAGSRLTRYADLLSDRKQLGKMWVGIILLGIVTSLPEAVTSLTAVMALGSGDLAVGNMLGSNIFNIFLIVIMDVLFRQASITNQMPFNRERLLPGLFTIIFTFIVILEMTLSRFLHWPQLWGAGVGSWMIFILYFVSVRLCFSRDHRGMDANKAIPPSVQNESMAKMYVNLVASATLVVIASVWLANVADQLALLTGWGRTFIGTLFLACATSLPEMVVTISALKLSSLDLALGNIFGSNMINIFIIALSDLAYRPQALLSSVAGVHNITAMAGILMTVVAFWGIRNSRKSTFFRLGWDSMVLSVLFVLAMALVYCFR